MKLVEYMKKNKLTIYELSKFLDVPYNTLHGWLRGRRRPELDMAINIELLTKSVVRCIDWAKDENFAKDSHMELHKTKVKKSKIPSTKKKDKAHG